MKSKLLALSALALATILVSPQSMADDEFLLGRTIVLSEKSDSAIIPLIGCREAKEIKVKAEREFFLQKVEFNFRNGEERTFQFFRKFDENDQSKWRKFSYKRCIKNIKVYGKAEDGRAGVKIYGKK